MFYELNNGTFAETSDYNNNEYIIHDINSNKTETNENSLENAIDKTHGIKSNCWNLTTLPQYHFPRHEFCRIWNEVFNDIDGIEWDNKIINGIHTDKFHSYYYDDEYYIIHLPSGTMINWYKHLGRTNTCNKNLSLAELKLFFILLKNNMTDKYTE